MTWTTGINHAARADGVYISGAGYPTPMWEARRLGSLDVIWTAYAAPDPAAEGATPAEGALDLAAACAAVDTEIP